jgi:hypothetical protein
MLAAEVIDAVIVPDWLDRLVMAEFIVLMAL